MAFDRIIQQKVMILNPNDPSGLGLFSKCARNHASKSKPHHPTSASSSRPKLQRETLARKKRGMHFGFEKQLSRESREKKFKADETPPVGQYNPVQRERPKLVWDILRVFTEGKKSQQKAAKHEKSQQQLTMQSQSIVQPISTPGTLRSEQGDQSEELMRNRSLKGSSVGNGVNRSQCMVDMSRMTGRKEESIECGDWGEVDIMQSVQYVRGKVCRNIPFGRRPKERRGKYDGLNVGGYNCDISLVRPRRKALLDFGVVRGRERKTKTEEGYGYQHYDYEGYVWQNSSQVFPNTKTHLIEFDKQTNRYKESRDEQGRD